MAGSHVEFAAEQEHAKAFVFEVPAPPRWVEGCGLRLPRYEVTVDTLRQEFEVEAGGGQKRCQH